MRSALRHAWFRDAAPRRLFALTLHHPPHPLFIYFVRRRTQPHSTCLFGPKTFKWLIFGLSGWSALPFGGAAPLPRKIVKIISTGCETPALIGVPPRVPQSYSGFTSFKSTVNPVEPLIQCLRRCQSQTNTRRPRMCPSTTVSKKQSTEVRRHTRNLSQLTMQCRWALRELN
jgi:hypothetical protein